MRLAPMAERNYNLIELGPWGTGKSFVYRETSVGISDRSGDEFAGQHL